MKKDIYFMTFNHWLLYQVYNKKSENDGTTTTLYSQYFNVNFKELPKWLKQLYNFDRQQQYSNQKYNKRYYGKADIVEHWEQPDKTTQDIHDLKLYLIEKGLAGFNLEFILAICQGYTLQELAIQYDTSISTCHRIKRNVIRYLGGRGKETGARGTGILVEHITEEKNVQIRS